MTPTQALKYLLHILITGQDNTLTPTILIKINKFSQDFNFSITDNFINLIVYSLLIITCVISIYYLIDIAIIMFKKIKH